MAKFNASEHWARARLKRPTLSQVISRYIAQEAVEFSVKFPNSRARQAVDEAMARVLDVVKDYDRVVEQVGVKKKKTPIELPRLGRTPYSLPRGRMMLMAQRSLRSPSRW